MNKYVPPKKRTNINRFDCLDGKDQTIEFKGKRSPCVKAESIKAESIKAESIKAERIKTGPSPKKPPIAQVSEEYPLLSKNTYTRANTCWESNKKIELLEKVQPVKIQELSLKPITKLDHIMMTYSELKTVIDDMAIYRIKARYIELENKLNILNKLSIVDKDYFSQDKILKDLTQLKYLLELFMSDQPDNLVEKNIREWDENNPIDCSYDMIFSIENNVAKAYVKVLMYGFIVVDCEEDIDLTSENYMIEDHILKYMERDDLEEFFNMRDCERGLEYPYLKFFIRNPFVSYKYIIYYTFDGSVPNYQIEIKSIPKKFPEIVSLFMAKNDDYGKGDTIIVPKIIKKNISEQKLLTINKIFDQLIESNNNTGIIKPQMRDSFIKFSTIS